MHVQRARLIAERGRHELLRPVEQVDDGAQGYRDQEEHAGEYHFGTREQSPEHQAEDAEFPHRRRASYSRPEIGAEDPVRRHVEMVRPDRLALVPDQTDRPQCADDDKGGA